MDDLGWSRPRGRIVESFPLIFASFCIDNSTGSHLFALVRHVSDVKCHPLPPRNDCNRHATDFEKLIGNPKRTTYTASMISGPSATSFSDVIPHTEEQLIMEIDVTKVKRWGKILEETYNSFVFPVFLCKLNL